MNLTIKNMVCDRCIAAVTGVFVSQGITPREVSLGEVKLNELQLDAIQFTTIDRDLNLLGFERIDDQKHQLVAKVKAFLVHQIHHVKESDGRVNWSELIVAHIGGDYGSISSLFSTLEGTTIEQYIIQQKTERVKELLLYDELSIKEIAYQLAYSSVAHLSTQFKKTTGITPSQFKSRFAQAPPRKNLDQI